eukprot:scaffold262511_cov28-Tisochrysis_lutea.AAC.4
MFPIEYRKPHDVSFDKNKSLMRTQITRGRGEDARDGSQVVLHFTVHAPSEDGGESVVYDSARTARAGLRLTLGETFHAEVLERAVLGMPPGSVVDVICTDTGAATDAELGITPPKLGPKAIEKIVAMQRREFGPSSRPRGCTCLEALTRSGRPYCPFRSNALGRGGERKGDTEERWPSLATSRGERWPV